MRCVAFLLAAGALAACPFKNRDGASSEDCPHAAAHLGVSPDRGQTTNKGCVCSSSCGATVDFGAAACDWCKTEGSCGDYSYTHFTYYDYCKYPQNNTWEAQSATDKLSYLLDKIYASNKRGDIANPLNLLQASVQTSFDNMWDVMPNGRPKYIHAVGAVAVFHLDIVNTKYTGVFSQGRQTGLMRLGSAKEITTSSGSVPGMGIKFLRSGVHSANFVVLHSLDGIKGYNMFSVNQSNHIPPPPSASATAILAEKFKQASNCVTMVGLSDACTWDATGKRAPSPVFPYKVIFATTGKASMPDTPQTTDQALNNLILGAPIGTNVYDVYAQEGPKTSPELLGKLTLASDFVSSNFGDVKLFFRHQRIEEDWQQRRDWVSDINAAAECGVSSVNLQPPAKCSTYSTRKEVQ